MLTLRNSKSQELLLQRWVAVNSKLDIGRRIENEFLPVNVINESISAFAQQRRNLLVTIQGSVVSLDVCPDLLQSLTFSKLYSMYSSEVGYTAFGGSRAPEGRTQNSRSL